MLGTETAPSRPRLSFTDSPFNGFSALGDVNGDGNLGFVFSRAVERLAQADLIPYLGDGHGNFTPDTNTYLISIGPNGESATVPTRVNNQAPALPNDNRLDLLLTLNSGSSDQTL